MFERKERLTESQGSSITQKRSSIPDSMAVIGCGSIPGPLTQKALIIPGPCGFIQLKILLALTLYLG